MADRKIYPPFFSFAHLIGTWFGVGRFPWAPGTVGTIFALPFAWGIQYLANDWSAGGALFLAAFALFWIGLAASNAYVDRCGRDDPKEVVVDEVVGLWIAVLFARPDVYWLYGLGFVMFRLFDIWKPWPVSWADTYLPRGWGVMVDDLIAGIYAAVFVYAAVTVYDIPDVRRYVDTAF